VGRQVKPGQWQSGTRGGRGPVGAAVDTVGKVPGARACSVSAPWA
jgi:hypothetical protein